MDSNPSNHVETKPRIKARWGPTGLHLFNRTTGLNLLVDELSCSEENWAKAPRQVSIALTNTCDLACPHCFAPKNPANLNFSQITNWLAELDANGAIGVGFGGGEPTLHRRFSELCAHTFHNTNLAVTFTTHGHHLNDSLLASLKGNVHFIRVSMDGVGSTYERLRGRSFGALQQRFFEIRKVSPFGINYVVNSETFPEIDAALDVAMKVGASELLLLPEQPVRGQGGISFETTLALQEWVARYSGKTPLAISEIGAEGMPICNPFENELGLLAYAHIDANGILKHTSYDSKGVVIGNSGVMSAIKKLGEIEHTL